MRLASLAILIVLSGCATAAPPPPVVEDEVVIEATDPILDDVRILADDAMAGRAPGTRGSVIARSYIEYRFEEIGIEPIGDSYEQPFVFTGGGKATDGVNMVGKIEGSSRSHRVLVVTAHYDHEGVVNGQIYNGADDNASGVAVMLAIAQSFKDAPPRHDIIFAAVDAEESSQRGSRVLVSDFPVPLETVALNVNLDMVSKNTKNELYAAGAAHFPYLKPRLEALAANAPLKLLLGHDSAAWGESQDWTTESDHVAFHERGIPWVYFGVEDHPEYHQPTDDFNTIPQDFFARSAATIVAAVRAFDADLDDIAKEAGR
jgi:Zn-dependent M28 family amino/carboxypeptidase